MTTDLHGERRTGDESERRGWPRRLLAAVDERLGIDALRYPVPDHANRLGWSLGGLTALSFLVLLVTGVYLAQFYNPIPEAANQSIRELSNVWLGTFSRSVHFWSAQAMYVLVILHLLRVIFHGSYKRPREGNYLVGVTMFALVIAALFTGTVLKWDQEGFEALAHNIEVAELLGGLGYWFTPEVASSLPILVRLYDAHVVIVPGLIIVLLVLHALLIKRHGMSEHPAIPPEARARGGAASLHRPPAPGGCVRPGSDRGAGHHLGAVPAGDRAHAGAGHRGHQTAVAVPVDVRAGELVRAAGHPVGWRRPVRPARAAAVRRPQSAAVLAAASRCDDRDRAGRCRDDRPHDHRNRHDSGGAPVSDRPYRRARWTFWALVGLSIVLVGALGQVLQAPPSPGTALALAGLGVLTVIALALATRVLLALTGRLSGQRGGQQDGQRDTQAH